MIKRISTLLTFAVMGLTAFGQSITGITYSGDVATLTRSTPPSGVIYYWQGTTCGTNTSSNDETFSTTVAGTYYIRAFSNSSSSSSWATSCASTVVLFPDVTAPVLSAVTAGPVEPGTAINATSNESGMLYLVPEGTAANYTAITTGAVDNAAASAGVPAALSTVGLAYGNYIVYAIDLAFNVSTASAVISVTDLTAPELSGLTTGTVMIGNNIAATSSENGMIYLVPAGTAADYPTVVDAAVATASASAGTGTSISTTGLTAGDYIVYAADAYNNVSSASDVITLENPDALNKQTKSNAVVIYPPDAEGLLTIRSEIKVTSANVYSITGNLIMKVNNPGTQIDLGQLNGGIYIVQVVLADNRIISRKIVKN
ncbi:MAG: T9SS type A sorting domain-containing protein [Bacteroidales bacterium]|nr:T9SS type A sorting domain-containing protein [Bacteroidales bacterium]